MELGKPRDAWSDESGAAIIEFTVTANVFLLVLFGVIEFGSAYFQWNVATKAVQYGARLAAVSSPVSSDLSNWNGLNQGGGCGNLLPGDTIPSSCGYDRVCTSSSSTAATGTCTAGTYNAAAMRRLVFGSGDRTACATTAPYGMCNFFDRIRPQNVVVRYQYTGLGYAGRPGGPVPTVTVSLTGITFQFIGLDGLLGLGTITIPGLNTTIAGEDLSVTGT